ncbi:glycoside hydrolase family 16 protein [Tamlana sp. I1]|uniref:glycoside hydrolase family 16 protein n=1 Tax=Tamlana sp. I1 TaxID=2762061 RepID=UPI0018906BA2|nr:glycoside hydrolase family 16 protein [Tamlana sp. I1]
MKLKALILLCIVFIILSCSDDTTEDIKEPILSDLRVEAVVKGTSVDNPNGDGNGYVEFKFTATNALYYQIEVEGQSETVKTNSYTYGFIAPGTNQYTVKITAFNNEQQLSETLIVRVFVTEEEETDLGVSGELVWSDEFNSGTLDLSKWSYETGTGVNGDWGTGQLDRATDRVENVSFKDGIVGADGGCLVITTRAENFEDRNYTSGRIRTFDKASWGPGHRIVARVYARDVKHQGQGFAFWMMPQEIPANETYLMWPQGGEIDIMEYVGAIPYNNLGTVHYAWEWQNNEWQSWNHGHLGGYYNYKDKQTPTPAEPGYGNYPPPDGDLDAGSAAFHTYGIDWYNDRLEFFVDDNVYHIHYFNDGGAYAIDGQDQIAVQNIDGKRVSVSEYSNHFDEWHPFEHKMYAILSAGVGGADHTYGGPIVPEAKFPCSVFIDWVRVYKL